MEANEIFRDFRLRMLEGNPERRTTFNGSAHEARGRVIGIKNARKIEHHLPNRHASQRLKTKKTCPSLSNRTCTGSMPFYRQHFKVKRGGQREELLVNEAILSFGFVTSYALYR